MGNYDHDSINEKDMIECNVEKGDSEQKGMINNEIIECNKYNVIVLIEVGNDVGLVEVEIFQVEEECYKIVVTLIEDTISNYNFSNGHKEGSLCL